MKDLDLNAFVQISPEGRTRAIIAIERNLKDQNIETRVALEIVLQGLGAEGYKIV